MRRRPLLATASLVLAASIVVAAPALAGAVPRPAAVGGAAVPVAAGPGQQPDAPADDGTGDSEDEGTGGGSGDPVPGDGIIPEPDSGRAPDDAGDRGGALQALVFFLVVAGLGGGLALAVRESRRNRAARAGAQSSDP